MAQFYQDADPQGEPLELFEPPQQTLPARRRSGMYDNVKRRIPRLRIAIEHCRRLLEPFRTERRDAVRQYVGNRYGDGARQSVPVNLLKLYTSIVVRHLVPQTPRCMIASPKPRLKHPALAMQDWVNPRLAKMHVDETLRRCALDALFGLGIAKVCLADPGEADGDYRKTPGEAFVSDIDLDDWVHDMGNRRLDTACWSGHRYRIPLELAQSSKLFDKGVRDDLTATVRTLINEQGDERIGTLTQDTAYDPDEYEEHVELWELYLRKEKLVVTLAADGPDRPLRVQEWVGPDCGPYHFLGFNLVPGNSMPSPPVHDLVDLHLLVNGIYRKLERQAQRQKSIGIVGPTASVSDGKAVVAANDGEVIRVDNPDAVQELALGGINQQNLAFAIHTKDLFAYIAGNLDLLGGLSPQSPTLGQDQMLQQNASRTIADMQSGTVSFTRSVLGALGWYFWNDPFETYRVRRTVPGAEDLEIWTTLSPEMRAVPFEDLDFDIDPYSMVDDSPATRLAAINQLMTQVLIPAGQLLTQQGISVDFEAYLKKVARYANMPDLNEIVRFAGLIEQPGVEPGPQASSGYTTRRYERVNRPGGTRFGKDNALMQLLMGGGVQEAEASAALGPTG